LETESDGWKNNEEERRKNKKRIQARSWRGEGRERTFPKLKGGKGGLVGGEGGGREHEVRK
jgi:hypothetical protein